MFDPKSYELRQWTITDSQGKDTTVLIDNVKQDVKIDPALFKIDYERNQQLNSSRVKNAKNR
jgi:outer membrane lipoprotein-sorting protein